MSIIAVAVAADTPIFDSVGVRSFTEQLNLEAQLEIARASIADAQRILATFNYADPNASIADLHDALRSA